MSLKWNDNGFEDAIKDAMLACDTEAKEMLDNITKQDIKVARKLTYENVEERTGNYKKNWKSEKAKRGTLGTLYSKAGNRAHHAHLIEKGHRNVDSNGVEHGYTSGIPIMQWANEEIDEFVKEELEKFLERVWD